MKKFLKVLGGLLGLACLAFILIATAAKVVKKYDNCDYVCSVYSNDLHDNYIRSRLNLTDSINKYIKIISPTSIVNGEKILEACDKYNLDVNFVLAQGQLESHFATKGLAMKTNSIFNVWAFDGNTIETVSGKGKYSHPDHSIIPYARLLNDRYLVDGKTEMDMLDNFIDSFGNRYASSPDYENKLLNIYKNVDNIVNISSAVAEYNKFKILTESY